MVRACLPVKPVRTTPARTSQTPVLSPFTIAISSAEQDPFSFLELNAGSRHGNRPLLVPVSRKYLKTGDYSIVGFEDQVAIERKSLDDLFGSLAGYKNERRDRLRKEHERMQAMGIWGGHVHLVIEASLADAMDDPPYYSNLNPASVLGTFVSWSQRYGVQWHWPGSRHWAEVLTFKLLERAYRKLTQPQGTEDTSDGTSSDE